METTNGFDPRSFSRESEEVLSKSNEQPMIFYIELFEEYSAYYMAARLQNEHWDVNLMHTGSHWILVTQALVSLDHQTISDLCDYLSDLSEYYGGSFKKWELGSYDQQV